MAVDERGKERKRGKGWMDGRYETNEPTNGLDLRFASALKGTRL